MDLGLKGKTAFGAASRRQGRAAAIAFPASERAGHITGQTLLVDGGACRGLA